MPISMSLAAHYVTQSSIYSCPMLGALTDRKIAKYQKQGFYTGVKVAERKEQRAKKQKKDNWASIKKYL